MFCAGRRRESKLLHKYLEIFEDEKEAQADYKRLKDAGVEDVKIDYDEDWNSYIVYQDITN